MAFSWPIILIVILLIIAQVFNVLGAIGLHRFPDVYTRLHAATKCTTFGTIFVTFTVIAYSVRQYILTDEGKFINMAIHTLIALIALLATNPTGAHAIARAAHKMGVKPEKAVKDDLKGADLHQKKRSKKMMKKKVDESTEVN
ncbi:MAG: monovalent cation/H(+) antiporter subunit G [Candidatus Thermoplasmatota archaeon]